PNRTGLRPGHAASREPHSRMFAKTILFVLLAALTAGFAYLWYVRERGRGGAGPNRMHVAIGFVTDFLDTLGIGSFAITTSLYRGTRLVDDAEIPGTLNVGHAIPTFAEAFIFIAVVDVDMTTLIAMIAAAVAGAWLGAGVVTRWPRRRIQIGMGS